LDKANEFHQKALTIDESMGNKQGMAADYGNLGLVYDTRGELDKAIEFYEKGLAIQIALGDKQGMAAKYGNLGIVYYTLGDLDKSIKFYQKSLAITEELGMKEMSANQYTNLGDVYEQKGNKVKAKGYYQKSLELYKYIGSPNTEKVQQLLNELQINSSFYSGGDGASLKTAIIINVNNESLGVSAEYKWIQKNLPKGTEKISQSLMSYSNHHYDLIKVELPNRTQKDIYFDITKFFGKD
jgi:tetratricopeptide (TPR) repeat protein